MSNIHGAQGRRKVIVVPDAAVTLSRILGQSRNLAKESNDFLR